MATKGKKEVKQSEPVTIMRSQIKLNPCNPKRHTDEQIALQKKNLLKNGYLGGIVWNRRSGNLVDGHRRCQAFDLVNKYDGTPETDYEIRVEACDMDERTELEQLTYMAVGNSKADYNLIADYIEQIDYGEVGLSEQEYNAILDLKPSDGMDGMETVEDGLVNSPMYEIGVKEETSEEVVKRHEEKPKMTAEQVKKEKEHCDDVASSRQDDMDLYIVVKFSCMEEKEAFCEQVNIVCDRNMTIDGITLMDKLDE